MAGRFEAPITIKDAIDNIIRREYLLPAIQRKFVWSSDKIETLFDSIMRGYPINSFMFWKIKDNEIKSAFKFYQFLTEYREFFNEDNPDIDTKGIHDFFAIIDGQQRLTSLYLGLKGTYAYRGYRKSLQDDQNNIPTRYLYINLFNELPEDNDRQMKYEFRFLTQKEYNNFSQNADSIWYKVNDILNFSERNDLDEYIDEQNWKQNKFAKETIRTLYDKIFTDQLINYYLETTQELDIVLDIFIRTNSGGEPLSFSDLLMSIITANWERDARKEIPEVIGKVFEIGDFKISKDFILKTCLVLHNTDIRFKIKNFTQENVQAFDQNWDRIRDSIIESFKLLENWGFNDSSLRAKNAVIPIIYYVYHNNLEGEINKKAKHKEDKEQMRKWLYLSLLKGVFGSHSDDILKKIRNILKDPSNKNKFPLEKIKDDFKADPSKNLTFDDDFIGGLLTVQKEDSNCYTVLSLLYSHLNFEIDKFHKDHLHPADYFKKLKNSSITKEEFSYYKEPKNWNSVVNLQLLNGNLNQSKLTTPLEEWVRSNNIDLNNQLIPNVSLDIKDFRNFIEERKKLLCRKFKEITE
jgi:uncharacterized protein with ParB-like and HNH nuclease domain